MHLDATYRLYRSTDGGATFTLMSTNNFANYVGTYVNGRNSVQNMRTRPYPFITADNSYGLLSWKTLPGLCFEYTRR